LGEVRKSRYARTPEIITGRAGSAACRPGPDEQSSAAPNEAADGDAPPVQPAPPAAPTAAQVDSDDDKDFVAKNGLRRRTAAARCHCLSFGCHVTRRQRSESNPVGEREQQDKTNWCCSCWCQQQESAKNKQLLFFLCSSARACGLCRPMLVVFLPK
jgi:hypothetical protein